MPEFQENLSSFPGKTGLFLTSGSSPSSQPPPFILLHPSFPNFKTLFEVYLPFLRFLAKKESLLQL